MANISTDNTKAPMGVAPETHRCDPKLRGATHAAQEYQIARYGGLLCSPAKSGGSINYLCTFCAQSVTGVKAPPVVLPSKLPKAS